MKIFAIGMNYAAHNQELHGTLKRPDQPVIFTKADSALLNQGKPFFIPITLGVSTTRRRWWCVSADWERISQSILPTVIMMQSPLASILQPATFSVRPLKPASLGLSVRVSMALLPSVSG